MITKTDSYRILTDGGSRGNPGKAAYGFVVYLNGEKIFEEGRQIGITTNNVAEYTGVVEALKWLIKNLQNQVGDIHFFMDSQLVAQQMSGVFKIKNPGLLALFRKAKALERQLPVKIIYTSIPREQNKEADRMVNLALDNLLLS